MKDITKETDKIKILKNIHDSYRIHSKHIVCECGDITQNVFGFSKMLKLPVNNLVGLALSENKQMQALVFGFVAAKYPNKIKKLKEIVGEHPIIDQAIKDAPFNKCVLGLTKRCRILLMAWPQEQFKYREFHKIDHTAKMANFYGNKKIVWDYRMNRKTPGHLIKILNKYPMRYLYHLVKKKGIHTGINILLKVEAEEQRCFIELGSYIYRLRINRQRRTK